MKPGGKCGDAYRMNLGVRDVNHRVFEHPKVGTLQEKIPIATWRPDDLGADCTQNPTIAQLEWLTTLHPHREFCGQGQALLPGRSQSDIFTLSLEDLRAKARVALAKKSLTAL